MTVVLISSFYAWNLSSQMQISADQSQFCCILLVKIKRNTEFKIAESKGKLKQHFKKRPNIYIFVYLPYFDHITICIFLVWVEGCVWFVWNVVCECCESFRLGTSECLYVFCPLFCVIHLLLSHPNMKVLLLLIINKFSIFLVFQYIVLYVMEHRWLVN